MGMGNWIDEECSSNTASPSSSARVALLKKKVDFITSSFFTNLHGFSFEQIFTTPGLIFVEVRKGCKNGEENMKTSMHRW